MPNEQLCLALGIPALVNVGLTAMILAYINSRIQAVQADIKSMGFQIQEVKGTVNARIDAVQTDIKAVSGTLNARIDAVIIRIDGLERRIDELRDTWKGDLRRVEEILDARLKHLEERIH